MARFHNATQLSRTSSASPIPIPITPPLPEADRSDGSSQTDYAVRTPPGLKRRFGIAHVAALLSNLERRLTVSRQCRAAVTPYTPWGEGGALAAPRPIFEDDPSWPPPMDHPSIQPPMGASSSSLPTSQRPRSSDSVTSFETAPSHLPSPFTPPNASFLSLESTSTAASGTSHRSSRSPPRSASRSTPLRGGATPRTACFPLGPVEEEDSDAAPKHIKQNGWDGVFTKPDEEEELQHDAVEFARHRHRQRDKRRKKRKGQRVRKAWEVAEEQQANGAGGSGSQDVVNAEVSTSIRRGTWRVEHVSWQ